MARRNTQGRTAVTAQGSLALVALVALVALSVLSALWAGPAGAAPGAPPSTAAAPAAAAAQAPTPFVPGASVLEGEVIVRFKATAPALKQHPLPAGASAEKLSGLLGQRAKVLAERLGRPLTAGAVVGERMQLVQQAGTDAHELARQLAQDPNVEFAVPNARRKRWTAPNDPLYGPATAATRPNGPDVGQWYLRAPDATLRSAIHIEAAWLRSSGSADLVVAVLDTGVRFEHPDLGRVASGGRLLPGYDFVSNPTVANDGDGRDADPSDPGDWVTAAEAATTTFRGCAVGRSSWHGTATASLVGAATNNAIGMAGVAPGVRVLPVRVLGKCFGVDSDILAAMQWAAGISIAGVPDNPNPARVINMSLGSGGACSAAYQSVVDTLTARGVVVVAAAGNSTGEPTGSPANCRGVVGVAAVRHAGTKVGFSDLGADITIAAPGGNCVNVTAGSPCLYPILAATQTGTQGPVATAAGSTWSDSQNITVGTSFASPLVAGVVGLVLSAQPSLTVAQLSALLQRTARAFPSSGADNGVSDPNPVPACVAPRTGVQQAQCYCPNPGDSNYPLCGAGLLDAGAAVAAAVISTQAQIASSPSALVAGNTIALSAAGSVAASGAHIVAWSWSLVNAGSTGAAFSSATNASSATLSTSAAGSLTVRLTVTDNQGASGSAESSMIVAAAPVSPPTSGGAATSAGTGGGAWAPAWLLGLALIVGLLAAAGPAGALGARTRPLGLKAAR